MNVGVVVRLLQQKFSNKYEKMKPISKKGKKTTPKKARILPSSLSCHLQLGNYEIFPMKYNLNHRAWKMGYISSLRKALIAGCGDTRR